MNSFPPQLIELARLFSEAGVSLLAVGGMVRNPLLSLPVSDMDITSALRPEAVLSLCEKNNIPTVKKGLAFGMVELHCGGLTFEHTTFRSDRYPEGGGHRPTEIRFSDTVEEDAFRRDLTVNALYRNILTGELIDPTGGMEDLRNKCIRATTQNPARIMDDDALRILRMVRFSCELGFAPEEKTLQAAGAAVKGLLDISPERVRQELDKILLSDVRYGQEGAVLKGLIMLDGLGVLDLLLPEVAAARGVEQNTPFHAYDVLGHLLHTAAYTPPELPQRLAGLLHDIGKPVALSHCGKMYGHDAYGAQMAEGVLRRYRYSNEVREHVCELIRHHMYDLKGQAKESTLRTWMVRRGPALTRELAAFRRADVYGSGVITSGPVATADRWETLLSRMQAESVPFTAAELNITGEEIMQALHLPPSEQIGALKEALLLHCARRPQDNSKEILLKLCRNLVNN